MNSTAFSTPKTVATTTTPATTTTTTPATTTTTTPATTTTTTPNAQSVTTTQRKRKVARTGAEPPTKKPDSGELSTERHDAHIEECHTTRRKFVYDIFGLLVALRQGFTPMKNRLGDMFFHMLRETALSWTSSDKVRECLLEWLMNALTQMWERSHRNDTVFEFVDHNVDTSLFNRANLYLHNARQLFTLPVAPTNLAQEHKMEQTPWQKSEKTDPNACFGDLADTVVKTFVEKRRCCSSAPIENSMTSLLFHMFNETAVSWTENGRVREHLRVWVMRAIRQLWPQCDTNRTTFLFSDWGVDTTGFRSQLCAAILLEQLRQTLTSTMSN